MTPRATNQRARILGPWLPVWWTWQRLRDLNFWALKHVYLAVWKSGYAPSIYEGRVMGWRDMWRCARGRAHDPGNVFLVSLDVLRSELNAAGENTLSEGRIDSATWGQLWPVLQEQARRGDYTEFRDLVQCYGLSTEEALACWDGCRRRLGLPGEIEA